MYPYVRVHVYNTNALLLEWIRAKFGGRIHFTTRPNKPQYKPSGQWVPSSPVALLRLIRPYLVAKTRQADILLLMDKLMMPPTKGRRLGVPPKVLQQRADLEAELRALNRRGR